MPDEVLELRRCSSSSSTRESVVDKISRIRKAEGAPGTCAQETMFIQRARRCRSRSDCEGDTVCAHCNAEIGHTSGILPDGRRLCSACLSQHLDRWLPDSPRSLSSLRCASSSSHKRLQSPRKSFKTLQSPGRDVPGVPIERHLNLPGVIIATMLCAVVVGFPVWRGQGRTLSNSTDTAARLLAAAVGRR